MCSIKSPRKMSRRHSELPEGGELWKEQELRGKGGPPNLGALDRTLSDIVANIADELTAVIHYHPNNSSGHVNPFCGLPFACRAHFSNISLVFKESFCYIFFFQSLMCKKRTIVSICSQDVTILRFSFWAQRLFFSFYLNIQTYYYTELRAGFFIQAKVAK